MPELIEEKVYCERCCYKYLWNDVYFCQKELYFMDTFLRKEIDFMQSGRCMEKNKNNNCKDFFANKE
jgi:hypothetical protein